MAENLKAGVDDEGMVEGNDFETYYRHGENGYIDYENQFVAVIFDDGGVFGETRIPFRLLREMGLTVPETAPWTVEPCPDCFQGMAQVDDGDGEGSGPGYDFFGPGCERCGGSGKIHVPLETQPS